MWWIVLAIVYIILAIGTLAFCWAVVAGLIDAATEDDFRDNTNNKKE